MKLSALEATVATVWVGVVVAAFGFIYVANKAPAPAVAAAKTEPVKQRPRADWRIVSDAHYMCERYVQRNLKDPSSYRRIRAPRDNGHVLVYSATNGFGGRIQNRFDCSPLVKAALKQKETKS